MALHWDTTKCDPCVQNDADFQNRETLIWSTLAVDLGSITEKNLAEWVFRLRFLDACGRGLTMRPMPVEILKRWTGLSCNVCDMTRKQWLRKQMEIMERRVSDLISYEFREKEVAASAT